MPRALLFFLSGFSLFLLFVFFSYLVHEDLFTKLDFDTTVKLQDNLSRRVDGFFSFFSSAGNFEVLLLVLIGILLFARKIMAGIITFGAFGLFHIIELFGKIFVNHPPPPEFMLRTEHPFDLPQFHIRSEYSYPSGHSGRTVFLSTLIVFFVWRSKRMPLIFKVAVTLFIVVINLIMLLSRIYLGEHWLSDVIGGVLLAFGLSLMSLSMYTLPKSLKLGR